MREIVKFSLPYVNGFYPIGTYGSGPFKTWERLDDKTGRPSHEFIVGEELNHIADETLSVKGRKSRIVCDLFELPQRW